MKPSFPKTQALNLYPTTWMMLTSLFLECHWYFGCIDFGLQLKKSKLKIDDKWRKLENCNTLKSLNFVIKFSISFLMLLNVCSLSWNFASNLFNVSWVKTFWFSFFSRYDSWFLASFSLMVIWVSAFLIDCFKLFTTAWWSSWTAM